MSAERRASRASTSGASTATTASAPSVELAPILGARRDGTASSDSARGLLMTVLGEFVLPEGGSAWTRSLLAVLDQLGVRDKTARQTLARAEGTWLERQRHGRETRWTLTSDAIGLLDAGAARIYGFGQSTPGWDGRWAVLLASVPEADRARRHRLTQALNWAGFGSLGNGTWISPWAEREPQAVDAVRRLELDATSFVGELGSIGSATDLARQAWDLPGLRRAYEEFLIDTDRVGHAAGDAAPGTLAALVHRWRRFPFLDPDLPTELLDDDWPGATAADRFAVGRAGLQADALAAWRAWEAGD